jgi:hypothetical protein
VRKNGSLIDRVWGPNPHDELIWALLPALQSISGLDSISTDSGGLCGVLRCFAGWLSLCDMDTDSPNNNIEMFHRRIDHRSKTSLLYAAKILS